MARRKRGADRVRVGKVTLYWHHGAGWVYFSEGTRRVRRTVGESLKEAEIVAAQTNLAATCRCERGGRAGAEDASRLAHRSFHPSADAEVAPAGSSRAS